AITALRSLVWSSQATGQETVALFELNKTLQEQSAHLNKILNLLFTQAVVYLTAGKLPQVELTARHVLRLTPHADYVLSQSYAHWALGIVYYEWNQLDTAIYHFSAVTANQHHAHFWVVRDAICGMALAYQAQGFETQARETARALLELVQEQNNMHELMVAYTFQAQLALLQDEVEAAEQWLELAGEQAVWGPMLFLEDEPITRARLLLARGDEPSVAQGQALLTRLLQHAEALHSTRKTIQVLALQAWAYELQGRVAEALAALERSLALARPGGFIRTFADLPHVARVVQELRSRRKAQRANDKNLEAYLQRLLVAMRAGPSQVGAEAGRMGHEGLEPLTGREWQILRLLDKELTNKEIARELVVTPGTVKVHTNSIYRKLSVTNRRGAIALAKALGLLAVK
ncbi:MAG TPA: LuxR C-terminal-related transcriptional regulator, partial [Ktedonobacteraceae bacterium]|nr:LuxR C-terminal-related transcriptional regulator [Ktedonobacteraceae bacterium]